MEWYKNKECYTPYSLNPLKFLQQEINMNLIIILILLLFFIFISIIVFIKLTYYQKTIKSISEIIRDRDIFIQKSNYSIKDSRDLMDYLVNQALLEWQIYNIDPNSENYMNEQNIENSIQYIMKKIMLEMTDSIKLRLSVGYPFETEEEMLESIKNRAKLEVLNYSIKQNGDIDNTNFGLKNINTF